VPPENSSGLIETYLAAMALLQSPLISDVTRTALTRLLQTLTEDIKAVRAQQVAAKTETEKPKAECA